MKVLAILQMIFGLLTSFTAFKLAESKAHIITPKPGWIDSPPPNFIIEFVLLFFGLAILICGFLQRRKHTQYAGIQLINGMVISVIAGFLALRAAIRTTGEISGIYYIAYLPLILGVVVFVIGVVQLIRGDQSVSHFCLTC